MRDGRRMPGDLLSEETTAFLDALPIAVTVQGVSTESVYFNRAARLLLGWDPADFFGRSDLEVGSTPQEREVAQAILEQLRAGRPWHGQFPIRTASGATLLAEVAAVPVVRDGQVVAIAAVLRDGTDGRLVNESFDLLDSLMNEAPVGIAFFDSSLRYLRVNRTLAEINGVSPEEHVGRTISEVVPGVDPESERVARSVLDSGRPAENIEVAGFTRAHAGELRHWLTSWYPVRVDGLTVGIGAVIVEVTERRRAEEERSRLLAAERAARADAEAARTRLELLAESSSRLSASLDWEATLSAVGRLFVPQLADIVLVDLLEDERIRRVHVVLADPERHRIAAPVFAAHAPRFEGPDPIVDVMRSGRSTHAPSTSYEQLVQIADGDEEYLEALRFVEGSSTIVTPLIARGRVIGAITMSLARGAGAYGAEDVRLADELARRAALAIDNARLYDAERRIADTLQRSMLPQGPLLVPGGDVAVRYVAAEIEAQVGGDFYDVVRLENRPWTMAVGDVGGKGVRAAAVMGQLRAGFRAYALEGHGPAGVVRRLDLLFETLDASDFTTCVVASYEPAGRVLRLANAGHLPPLLRRADGACEWLEVTDSLPLGLAAEGTPSEHATTLGEGDLLMLFTDGLVERRGESIDFGLARVERAFDGDLASRPVEEIASALLEASLRGARRTDDIALLVFRAH